MSSTLSTPAAIAVVVAAAFLVGDTALGADDDIDDLAVVRCGALDDELLDIDWQPSGDLRFVYPGDAYGTCNEAIVVTSYATDGPVIDNHQDPVVDQIVFQVAELEAAGPAGVTVEPELDECWAGLEVHRDGDTLLWAHVEGDGCATRVLDVESGHPQHSGAANTRMSMVIKR